MASRATCNGNSVPVVRLSLEKERCVRGSSEKVTQARDVLGLLQKHYSCKPQEYFLAVHLQVDGSLLGIHEVAMGAISQTQVDPRVLYAGAIASGAQSIILVHNHPSGDATPSADDIALTRRLREGAQLLGIRVLDHLIVGRGGAWTSFAESGL